MIHYFLLNLVLIELIISKARFPNLEGTKYSREDIKLDCLLSNSFCLLYTLGKVIKHLQSA